MDGGLVTFEWLKDMKMLRSLKAKQGFSLRLECDLLRNLKPELFSLPRESAMPSCVKPGEVSAQQTFEGKFSENCDK